MTIRFGIGAAAVSVAAGLAGVASGVCLTCWNTIEYNACQRWGESASECSEGNDGKRLDENPPCPVVLGYCNLGKDGRGEQWFATCVVVHTEWNSFFQSCHTSYTEEFSSPCLEAVGAQCSSGGGGIGTPTNP